MPMIERLTNILLVDDDEVDVMNIQRAFAKAEVPSPLYRAENGQEALDMLRGNVLPAHRRLVLLDLNMPRMNGLEFLRELRADPALRKIPVVVLTTSADERDRAGAYAHCVAGYLIKPVAFSETIEFARTLHRYWSLVELS